jgi:DNA-binding NtrC family response regulator
MRSAGEPRREAPPDALTVRVPSDLRPYEGKLYETLTSELERKLVVAALRQVRGNQVLAARLLGISRVMLHDRIKRYGIKTEIFIAGL